MELIFVERRHAFCRPSLDASLVAISAISTAASAKVCGVTAARRLDDLRGDAISAISNIGFGERHVDPQPSDQTK
ncbi:MAG TPA: hypothetical protein VGG28_18370 [Kofleriaceae bacterium]|jgi:hypothetical protein